MLTMAVLGNTNDHQVIWNGILWFGPTYFHKEPTDTRKNHMDRPQSQSATRMDTTLMHGAAMGVARKSGGMIASAWYPSCATAVSTD